jgi:hypothetical protein
MLDINFAHNYNLSGNYNVNRIGLPNSRVNMNASQINARNVHSGTSNMPFSNSVYIDHNSWIKSEVKDELDTYGCINANLSTNTIPPFINRFIKREPDNNYGSCNSNNNEFNNSVITSTSANVSTNGVFFTQIQNLALKECAREIDVACDALGISAGKTFLYFIFFFPTFFIHLCQTFLNTNTTKHTNTCFLKRWYLGHCFVYLLSSFLFQIIEGNRPQSQCLQTCGSFLHI